MLHGVIIENPKERSPIQNPVQLPSPLTSSVSDNTAQSSKDLFTLGESYFKKGDFKSSIPYLRKAKSHFMKQVSFKDYFTCYDMLFHALYEQCEKEELEDMKGEFEAVCSKYNIEKDARTLAGMIFYFIDTRKERKIPQDLQKILNLALSKEAGSRKKNDRIGEFEARLDVMYCLYGYVLYYYKTKQIEKCREKLESANMLLDDYQGLEEQIREEKSRTDNIQDQKTLQEILWAFQKTDSFVRKADIHIKYMESLMEKDYKRRETLLWEVFERAKGFCNDYLMGYIYINMSENYIELDDPDQAATFLKLAEKYTDFNNFKRLGQRVHSTQKKLEQLQSQNQSKDYDIIFDRQHRSIVERQKGCISFKNQFILWDIMNLLASRPGESFSKRKLMETVWKQNYMPSIHDNKIYVTLKRLRELVEQNSRQPVYIRRSRKGYHLNEGVKILIK